MKKPTIKRIQSDKPNEQAIQLKERIATLEANVKRVDDEVKDMKELQRSR